MIKKKATMELIGRLHDEVIQNLMEANKYEEKASYVCDMYEKATDEIAVLKKQLASEQEVNASLRGLLNHLLTPETYLQIRLDVDGNVVLNITSDLEDATSFAQEGEDEKCKWIVGYKVKPGISAFNSDPPPVLAALVVEKRCEVPFKGFFTQDDEDWSERARLRRREATEETPCVKDCVLCIGRIGGVPVGCPEMVRLDNEPTEETPCDEECDECIELTEGVPEECPKPNQASDHEESAEESCDKDCMGCIGFHGGVIEECPRPDQAKRIYELLKDIEQIAEEE